MNAIERLRGMMRDFPNGVPDEECAEWLHENAAAVDALYQAANAVLDKPHPTTLDALAAAVRRVEGE